MRACAGSEAQSVAILLWVARRHHAACPLCSTVGQGQHQKTLILNEYWKAQSVRAGGLKTEPGQITRLSDGDDQLQIYCLRGGNAGFHELAANPQVFVIRMDGNRTKQDGPRIVADMHRRKPDDAGQ